MSNELNATITAYRVDAERDSLMSLPTLSMLLAIGWGAGALLRDRAVRHVAVLRRRG